MSKKLDIQLGSLDFESIKQSIINHLKEQDTLKDYDYSGSAAQVLLDILAYNTLYYGYYANMIASEMFLDTAQREESLISLVKPLGYVVPGKTSSRARVKVRGYGSGNPVIPSYTRFTGRNEAGTSYNFYTTENYATDSDGEAVITIVEGNTLNRQIPVLVDTTTQKAFLSGLDIDISTLTVEVYNSTPVGEEGDVQGWEVWSRAGNIESNLDSKSKVYWLERSELGFFLVFGGNLSDIIADEISPQDRVRVSYLKSSGELGNDVSNFRINGSGAAVDTISLSTGGTDKPDLEAIRFFAPKWFASQDRAVTVEDCRALLAKEGFVSGEQDPYSRFNVWGGESMDPPRYGRVFVSLNTTAEQDPVQATVARQLLERKTCVSIIPEFVDVEDFVLKIAGDVHFNPREITREQFRSNILGTIDELYGEKRFEKEYSLAQMVNEMNQSVGSGGRISVSNLNLEVQTTMNVSANTVQNKYFGNKMKPGTLRTVNPTPASTDLAARIDAPDGLLSLRTSGSVNPATGRQNLELYYIDNGFISVVETNAGYWTPDTPQCEVRIKQGLLSENFDVVATVDDTDGSPLFNAKNNQFSNCGTDFTVRQITTG